MLTNLKDALMEEGELLEGVVRVQSYGKATKRNGGFYGNGVCLFEGGASVPFKIWDEIIMGQLYDISKQHGDGIYLEVKGRGNVYNNSFSLIITDFRFPEQGNFKLSDFVETKNDINELMATINTILGNRVTPEGRQLVGKILSRDVATAFMNEFAGMRMHDASPSGLLNHTRKMLELTELVMQQHNNFSQDEQYTDLIYIGVLLHDIGKIFELNDGVYTQNSIATHRFLGAELIYEFKKEIVDVYDEHWYYNLISVITQHHGQYEERPRTIFAYVVHLIDMFDTSATILEERIEESEDGQEQYIGDFRLRIKK